MKSFWEELPKPFTVLAPMEGVTDAVFRQMMVTLGKPDVFFTEFVSTDGIVSVGKKRVSEALQFNKNEQPIVAQIWGATPKHFYESAKYCKELGFVGIDVNMGCPVRTIVKNGGCSALLSDPVLAKEVIAATKEGAEGLPVSVKTRIGRGKEEITEWIGFLLRQDLATLSVHLRTVKELSKVPAHWELMPKIMQLRDEIAPKTLIVGNGDVMSLSEVSEKYETYHADGFMVGKGVFANPWVFNRTVDFEKVTTEKKIDTFLEHITLFDKTWGTEKNPAMLKKFCKTYLNNFPDASKLREQLMETRTSQELVTVLIEYKNKQTI